MALLIVAGFIASLKVAAIFPLMATPVAAMPGTVKLTVGAVMSACLFTYGIGVAEDRAQPWDPYVRTLPAGPLPRFAGRI